MALHDFMTKKNFFKMSLISLILESTVAALACKAFCEFLFRTVYYGDYLRVPYNNQK
jgi:hypothetical protein